MTDIVERLRSPRTEQGDMWPHPNLHDEAADAIIRLCEENERLREALKPFARMAEDYEDWETEKITMIVLLYHLRDAAAAIRESGE